MEILTDFCRVTFVALLALSGCVGLLAVVSPRAFVAVSAYSNQAINKQSAARRSSAIDRFVLAHSRPFGIVAICVVGFLWLVSSFGPEAYSKSFFLIIVAVAMLAGVLSLTHIMRQSREIAERLEESQTDPLTGLTNRRVFDVELSRRLAQRQRQGTPLCLLIMDIDKYKSFNDDFGHLLGDEILKQVAKVLQANVRHEELVARLGGDEFVVLLPGSELDEACQAAERLRSAVSDRPLRYEKEEHALTVSIGVAEAQLGDDTTSLLKRSDSALYAAKGAGRNCCFRHGGPEPATPSIITP